MKTLVCNVRIGFSKVILQTSKNFSPLGRMFWKLKTEKTLPIMKTIKDYIKKDSDWKFMSVITIKKMTNI